MPGLHKYVYTLRPRYPAIFLGQIPHRPDAEFGWIQGSKHLDPGIGGIRPPEFGQIQGSTTVSDHFLGFGIRRPDTGV